MFDISHKNTKTFKLLTFSSTVGIYKKINGHETSWALGCALNLLNQWCVNQSINQLFHLYAYSSRLWLILSRQNPYPLSILNIMFHDVCIMQYNITNCKSTLEVCTYVPFVCKCMSNVYKVELGERIKYIVWCVVYVLYYTVQYSTIIRRRKNKLNSKSINVAVAGQEMPVHESVFSNRNGWLPNQEFSYCSASGLVSKRLCLYTNM